jgi:hypothetical protein
MVNCLWCKQPIENREHGQRLHRGDCTKKYFELLPKNEPKKRNCEWCGEPLPDNSPSAMKYHDGDCHILGYREQGARASRAFRFRREMGIAFRR